MTLEKAQKNKAYTIKQILEHEEEITSRFYKLGLYPGGEIVLRRKAPLFADPLLFEVDGCQIALTKKEASLVEVLTDMD